MKHVLIFFTDQQRRDTLGAAYGNPAVQTPHLDELAKDSVIFDNAYTPSPVCVPARLSMYSGQYPARTGCNNNNVENVYKGEGYYNEVTKAGYESCAIGKMHHLIDPYGLMGFKSRISQEELSKADDDYTKFIMEKHPTVFDYNGMRSEMYYVPQISQLPAEDHPTQWIGDQTVDFIEGFDPTKEMFLVSSFIHPHPPYAPPAPWQKLFREDPPEPYVPEHVDDWKELVGKRCSLERLETSHQDILRTKNFYYSCVSFVDYQVGRIIKALKDKGMYDDTLIIYASDHGDMMGDYNAIGKRTMLDSSVHIPFMVKYPGVKPQRRADPASLVDIAPTILGYIGKEYDKAEYDGVDLFKEKHDFVYSQHNCGEEGLYMVTDGKTKLIYFGGTQKYYYFNAVKENENLYSEADATCMKMKELLDQYRLSDQNKKKGSATYEPYTKNHPHYPGRMDHTLRHEEEIARVPGEYKMDI